MPPETKVTGAHQTQVPAEIRERYGVEPGDTIVWDEAPDGTLAVRFRKPGTLRDLVGAAPGISDGDAVAAKKRAQRGQLGQV